ncbi:MAG: hypothetical protein NDJ94_16640, partial [Vicinamibacteria bacterium]|nr:hypothetical protein [Vicinamibacteria bacterium]
MTPTRTALRGRFAAAALPLGVVALLGLLVGLGAMQYRWLDEIRQAELQRRRAAARGQADAFARDLDREVGRLGVLLSVDQRALAEGRFGELGDRLRAWRSESPLRAMLKDVWLLRAVDGAA